MVTPLQLTFVVPLMAVWHKGHGKGLVMGSIAYDGKWQQLIEHNGSQRSGQRHRRAKHHSGESWINLLCRLSEGRPSLAMAAGEEAAQKRSADAGETPDAKKAELLADLLNSACVRNGMKPKAGTTTVLSEGEDCQRNKDKPFDREGVLGQQLGIKSGNIESIPRLC